MKRTLLLCALVSAMAFAGSLYAWPLVGPTVPIHWGLGGQPNGYGPKALGLLLLPALALLTPALVAVLLRFDPRKEHIEQSMPALRTVLVGIAAFLAVVHALMLRAMLGDGTLPEGALLVAMGGLFVVIGGALPGLRSNYFAGFRTPWTLQSERVWARTHKVAGACFAATGVVVAIAGLALHGLWAIGVAVAALFIGVTVPVVLSYVYWKEERAPTR